MSATATCPDDDTLIAMVEHALPSERLGEIEAHVDGCQACRRVIASLAEAATAVPSLAAGSSPRAEGASVDLERGALIGERYRIERPVGRGGMGTVYLARDISLGRDVAVKIHRAPAGRERLYQEALAMARLAHPNVVGVFEIGVVDDRRFVAMEYVRGGTSRDWLATPRTWREVVALFAEAGEGIAAAHRAGLVHRDFKPENVLVGEDGRPRVSDFGLVQEHGDSSPAVADTPALAPLTETGGIVGTPAYMAPEQLDGGSVDGRCDQFAFCVSVWEALHGVRPFPGATTSEIQAAIVLGRFRPAARGDIPSRVRRVLERGLAAEPADRFPDMPALLAALRRTARPRRARRIGLAAAAAVVLGSAGVLLAGSIREHRHVASCAAAADRVRDAYGPAVRAAIGKAFAATGAPFAASAADHAGTVLVRFAGALAARTDTACVVDEPAPIATVRAQCLHDRLADLEALATSFQHADRRIVANAASAAYAIAVPAPCDDTRALLAAPPVELRPTDVAPLVEARVMLATGHYAEGVARVEPLVAAAKARGDRVTELTALHLLTDLRVEVGPIDVTKAELRDEVALAETVGDDTIAAASHSALASIAGVDDRDFVEAHRELELAHAKLTRLGGANRAAEASLLATEGQVLYVEFRQADSEAVLRRAVALLEATYGPDHPQVGLALGTLNQTLMFEGKNTEALEMIERALAIFERAFGHEHPLVAGSLQTRGQTLTALGRLAEANADLERADALFVRTQGEAAEARIGVLYAIGQNDIAQDHADAALEVIRSELALIEKVKGAASGEAASAHCDLGTAYAAARRYTEARDEHARSITMLERVLAKDDVELAAPLEGLARDLVALHHARDAVPLAERALALRTSRGGYDPTAAVELQMLVADAHWESGDHGGARALAEQARAAPGSDADRGDIATWLATHVR